jgi:hypothetical protein
MLTCRHHRRRRCLASTSNALIRRVTSQLDRERSMWPAERLATAPAGTHEMTPKLLRRRTATRYTARARKPSTIVHPSPNAEAMRTNTCRRRCRRCRRVTGPTRRKKTRMATALKCPLGPLGRRPALDRVAYPGVRASPPGVRASVMAQGVGAKGMAPMVYGTARRVAATTRALRLAALSSRAAAARRHNLRAGSTSC